ncbi:MAG: hypothetical protein OEW16_13960, partial [Gammaproteobacteria bacterium]|nr:hypothetical protein [Gammaproteobacteria bacterium]
ALGNITIEFADINLVSDTVLMTVPGMGGSNTAMLLATRPHFSVSDALEELPELGPGARELHRFVTGPDFSYPDKPAGYSVTLSLELGALIVLASSPEGVEGIQRGLEELGYAVHRTHSDSAALICSGGSGAAARRSAKQIEGVLTVAPLFRNDQGKILPVHPFRVETRVVEAVPPQVLTQVFAEFTLELIMHFDERSALGRVNVAPHDIGAIYRVLRRLAADDRVAYAEPQVMIH